MSATFDMTDIVREAFSPIMHLPAWNVRKGHGSVFWVEFGEPRLDIREPVAASSSAPEKVRKLLQRRRVTPVGTWTLWIDYCDWEISLHGEPKAHSEASELEIDEGMRAIDGQKLVAAVVGPEGTSTFEFDLGGGISTRPYGEGPGDEQWLLFAPGERVLLFSANGLCRWVLASDEM